MSAFSSLRSSFAIVLILLLLPWVTLAAPPVSGGFSGVGGGEGVAIFPTSEDAQAAQVFVDAGQPIPDELLNKATIQTLESWELDQSQLQPLYFPPETTWQQIHDAGKENLRLISPLLARRLENVSEWIAFSTWVPEKSLRFLGDANPMHPLKSHEIRVQLALRDSEGNNKVGEGPVQNRLKLKVHYDQRLFQKMKPIDQAMLVHHEEFYSMSQSVGHNTSDAIRGFVKNIFAPNVLQWRIQSENGVVQIEMLALMQKSLVENFGDYPLFFIDTDPIHGEAFTADHHFSVFLQLLKKMRELNKQCIAENPHMDRFKVCPGYVHKKLFMELKSDEQSFVYLSYFYLQMTLKLVNAETIMDSRRSAAQYQQAMQIICKNFENTRDTLISAPHLMSQALNYCKAFSALAN